MKEFVIYMQHPPIPKTVKEGGQEAFSAWASTEKISLIEAAFQKIKPDILAILIKHGCPENLNIERRTFWGTTEAAKEIGTLEGVDVVKSAFYK